MQQETRPNTVARTPAEIAAEARAIIVTAEQVQRQRGVRDSSGYVVMQWNVFG